MGLALLITKEQKVAPLISATELRTLSRLSSLKAIWAFVFNWGCIAGAIFLAQRGGFKPFFIPLAWIVVAARQHGFMILMHEGAHQRIATKLKINDWMSDFFAAYPIFLKTAVYRQNHLAHHLYVNSDKDPDWIRKAGTSDWKYPMSQRQAWNLVYKYSKGFGIPEMFRMWLHLSGIKRPWSSRSTAEKKDFVLQIGFYLVAGLISWRLDVLGLVFLYWILPQLTILPLLLRLRSVAEHFGLSYSNDLNQTRNIVCTKVESFFVAPFNVSYHLNHHLYPTVPFYNLKKLNETLMKVDEFKSQAHINTSYLGRGEGSLVKDLIL